MDTAGWLMLPTHAMAEKGFRMNTTRAIMNWPAPSCSPTRKPGCVTKCFRLCIMAAIETDQQGITDICAMLAFRPRRSETYMSWQRTGGQHLTVWGTSLPIWFSSSITPGVNACVEHTVFNTKAFSSSTPAPASKGPTPSSAAVHDCCRFVALTCCP